MLKVVSGHPLGATGPWDRQPATQSGPSSLSTGLHDGGPGYPSSAPRSRPLRPPRPLRGGEGWV